MWTRQFEEKLVIFSPVGEKFFLGKFQPDSKFSGMLRCILDFVLLDQMNSISLQSPIIRGYAPHITVLHL